MDFESVEAARIKYRNKIIGFTSAVVISFLLIAITAVIFANTNGDLANTLMISSMVVPLLSIVAMVLISFFVIAARNDFITYKRTYKGFFIEQALLQVFTDLHYNHESGIDKQILDSTGMINTGDKFFSNDLTTGKYKNVPFTQADVDIQVKKSERDNDLYSSIFLGRFMIFEFPKKFNFRVMIVSKSLDAQNVINNSTRSGRKFSKFEVESSNFNKQFKLYAEDGFEAFYLLDPAFVASIEDLGDKYGKKIILVFADNRLYIGLNEGKDSFEPPRPFRPIDKDAEVAKVAGEIKIITDFVDGLSLDRKIFS
jgi:hypothetical protein